MTPLKPGESPAKVKTLKQTCDSCPSQWEGTTTDGRHIYIRYRWGYLNAGIADTFEDAVRHDVFGRQVGDGMDGHLSEEEMQGLLRDVLVFP